MDRQTNGQIDRSIDILMLHRNTDEQINKLIDRQMDSQSDEQIDQWINRQMDRWADRYKMDRQTDLQMGRQIVHLNFFNAQDLKIQNHLKSVKEKNSWDIKIAM